MPIIQEKPPTGNHTVMGFCLADANNERHRSNHYPFLISYIGTFDKNKTLVKGFKIYVLSEMDLPDVDLTDEQRYLMGICFAMKKIAPVIGYESIEDVQVLTEEQEENKSTLTLFLSFGNRQSLYLQVGFTRIILILLGCAM